MFGRTLISRTYILHNCNWLHIYQYVLSKCCIIIRISGRKAILLRCMTFDEKVNGLLKMLSNIAVQLGYASHSTTINQ